MKSVNKAIRKKDAMELLLGKPVYTDDIAPKDCLVVKLLRSPYANAFVKNINTDIAMKVPGIEAIFTYKDVDQNMKCLNHCLISLRQRIMRFLYTLRITGRHYVRLELIIKEIFAHMMRAATEISIKC